MENFEIIKSIELFSKRLEELKEALDMNQLEQTIKENDELITSASFYDNMSSAQKVLKQLKKDKDTKETFFKLQTDIEDLTVFFDMQKSGEATEEDLDGDVRILIKDIESKMSQFEEKMLLTGDYDDCHALFELHPGAGGTESQDWTAMLFRMFKRYAEANKYEFEVLDYLEGEEAGIKSVTFMMKADKAYGYLKSEHGVHRLVRISPFDSGARRHTSFCGCTVTPVFTDSIAIEVKPEDVRIDVYRSSGAGGQSVNTTDSAIRITHLKTGLVVTCQNERSQIQNREKAMEILKSKLYKLEREAADRQLKKISGEIAVNGFSGQIRSYVFHPYSMVKDHRTNFETSNVLAVMDGDLDGFINAFLKSTKKSEG